jgi:hypothetical protein
MRGQEYIPPKPTSREAFINFMDKQKKHAVATGVGIINAIGSTPEIGEAIHDFAVGDKALAISKGIRTVMFAALNTGVIATLENKFHKAQNRQNI